MEKRRDGAALFRAEKWFSFEKKMKKTLREKLLWKDLLNQDELTFNKV